MIDKDAFDKMDTEEQIEVFKASSIRDKGELLIRAKEPEIMTQRLSQEELYLLTREMDLEERCEILRIANFSQLEFLSDMDCWDKDRISPQGFLEWLEALLAASDDTLFNWITRTDREGIVSGFKNVMRVMKPDWEWAADEMLGDMPFFTLDQRYHIYVDQENFDTTKRVIEILFERHRGLYVAILESILSEMNDLLEEEAYRLREARLADRGFPDAESAHRIYQRITAEDFEKYPRKNTSEKTVTDPSFFSETVPNYLTLWTTSQLFLDRALNQLEVIRPEHMDGVKEEIAWLANKVIACDGVDFSSEERVKQGVLRARQFVSIGLEILSEGDVDKACRLLSERWLEPIFRVTSTRLLILKDHAFETVRQYWDGSRELFIEFLDPTYQSIYRGLISSLPKCYDEQAVDQPNQLRDFASLKEIDNAALAIRQIKKTHDWLVEGSKPESIAKAYQEIRDFQIEGAFYLFLGTAFVRTVLGRKGARLKPITAADAQSFVEKAFEARDTHFFFLKDVKESFLNEFFSEQDRNELLPLWALVFQDIEYALDGMDANNLGFSLVNVIWMDTAKK